MTITVPGYGGFEIPNEKSAELVSWLERNSVKVQESQSGTNFEGMTLINEARQ